MKTTLWRNIFREFKFSFARFVSITTLLGLGVFVLVGLKMTGPDMRTTGDHYYTTHKMADAMISSNVGISAADQSYMRNLPHIKDIQFGTTKDAVIKDTNQVIRLSSSTSQVSISQVVSGRLPKRSSETAISNHENHHYKLGQHIKLVNNQDQASVSGLKKTTYRVVGFITSSDYLMKQNLGVTSAGVGQVDTFGVLDKAAFTSHQPTFAKLTYNNVHGESYSNQYENTVRKNVSQVENRLDNRAKLRQQQLKQTALTNINQRQRQLDAKTKRLNQQKNS